MKQAAPVHVLVAAGQQCFWLNCVSGIVPLLLHDAGMKGFDGIA